MTDEKRVIFSEDTYVKLLQNASIWKKCLERSRGTRVGNSDLVLVSGSVVDGIDRDLSAWCDFAGEFDSVFRDQFQRGVRTVCTNPNCNAQYAYFYADFFYCPKCGTRLMCMKKEEDPV